ncbi:hypothetical protein [Clostridium puniceum]|uniref:hypothetical protein n=1 Tax=Clostridium puniceum TaxID=29367 RepID=UPI00098C0D21|nr:hypothetical protein [Clostridium puniceum]
MLFFKINFTNGSIEVFSNKEDATNKDAKDNNVATQKDSDNIITMKTVQTQIVIKQKKAQIVIPIHKICR